MKASKRVVLEKQQNGILFMKRPPARWSSSQDLKHSLSSQKRRARQTMKLLLSAAILAASCAQEDCPFCPDGLEVVSFSFMSGREAVVLRLHTYGRWHDP